MLEWYLYGVISGLVLGMLCRWLNKKILKRKEKER